MFLGVQTTFGDFFIYSSLDSPNRDDKFHLINHLEHENYFSPPLCGQGWPRAPRFVSTDERHIPLKQAPPSSTAWPLRRCVVFSRGYRPAAPDDPPSVVRHPSSYTTLGTSGPTAY